MGFLEKTPFASPNRAQHAEPSYANISACERESRTKQARARCHGTAGRARHPGCAAALVAQKRLALRNVSRLPIELG